MWDVANGTWVSGCRIDAGDQFNGAFVQPPLEPIVLNLTVDDDASTVRTALSGGTRAVVGNCDLVDPGDPDVRDVEIPTVPTAPVAAVSADEQTIATRDTQNGTVRLFDTSGKQVAPELRANTAFPGNYIGVQFSPDGRLVIPTDAADGDVKLWSISNSRPARERCRTIAWYSRLGDEYRRAGPGGEQGQRDVVCRSKHGSQPRPASCGTRRGGRQRRRLHRSRGGERDFGIAVGDRFTHGRRPPHSYAA